MALLVVALVSFSACASGLPRLSRGEWTDLRSRFERQGAGLPPLELSRSQQRAFSALVDPFELSDLYGFRCNFWGLFTEKRVATRALVANALVGEHQVVAFRYALRFGPPAGRLYSAEALLLLQSRGFEVADSDLAVIQSFVDSPFLVRTCYGDVLGARGSDLLVKDMDADLLAYEWKTLVTLGYVR